MKIPLLITVLLGLLAVTIALSFYVWWQLGDVDMSAHGIAALVLGALATLALGVGLMFLVFYSSRHGHDDPHREPRDKP
jgi:hypothetical protein